LFINILNGIKEKRFKQLATTGAVDSYFPPHQGKRARGIKAEDASSETLCKISGHREHNSKQGKE
jgi:hypothetical protein